jgi:hypothetical protein
MLTAADCNLNGTHDLCDIEAGTSEDLDYDGYPDECETPACQLEWIRASDAAANDRFGQYLDTDGASVVVGAPNDDGAAGADQGSAWVFARTGTHFQVEWKLLANDAAADDHLGSSIEVRGDWAVVGAPGNDASGSGAGAAYLFKRVGPGLWSQAAKFYGSNTNAADAFGSVLEWNDELLFVSATTKETPLGADRGAVYVFRWNGTAFNELAQIHAPDGLAGDRFGSELDYENGRLAVGAAFADTPSGVDSGAAYVFRQSGSAWTFEQKLPGRAAGSLAGRSLSLEDAWLAVGQPEDGFAGTYAGLVQVWHRDALTNVWSLDSDLRGPDTNDYDFFGYAVQYVGTRLLVGAPFRSWNPAHAAGEVYVFNRAGSAWLDTQRMRPEFPSDNLTYGYSVCHANGVLAIGASADDAFGPADTGSAYVYGTLGDDCNLNGRCDLCDIRDLSVPDTNGDGLSDACEYSQLCTCPPNLGPCGNHDASAGCANSSGAGALITPAGSTSVSSDDLVLTTSGLPVNKSSIMFMSGNFTAIPLPFSDGRRCVAAPLLRWPTTNSGASGSVAYGPGLAAQSATLFGPAGSILAGSTWGFQTWYRDPSGPCGLLTNISAAVKATFLP